MLRQATLEEQEPVEYRIVRDGAQMWVRDKAFALPAEAGNSRRVAGLARDVTEAKRAEQQRELLIGELNHRVKNTLALSRPWPRIPGTPPHPRPLSNRPFG